MMIRFVDLTPYYWTDPESSDNSPICAFLNTVTDNFIKSCNEDHTFLSWDDFDDMDEFLRERIVGLMPPGFFDGGRQND